MLSDGKNHTERFQTLRKEIVHNFVNNYTKFFDRNRGRQESCHNPIFYHIITYMEEAYELPEKAPYYSD
jgi:hypothetical protein